MGLPIAFATTGGEVSDFKGYLPIMNADGPAPKVLLADKGYDADFIHEDMEKRDGMASHDKAQPPYLASGRSRDLRAAQYGRALLQQAQKCSTPRSPVRQNL